MYNNADFSSVKPCDLLPYTLDQQYLERANVSAKLKTKFLQAVGWAQKITVVSCSCQQDTLNQLHCDEPIVRCESCGRWLHQACTTAYTSSQEGTICWQCSEPTSTAEAQIAESASQLRLLHELSQSIKSELAEGTKKSSSWRARQSSNLSTCDKMIANLQT